MIVNELQWDDENTEHIARHSVDVSEVEDICFEPHLSFLGHNRRYILYGKTTDGRYLKVVLERLSNAIFRPITALDVTAEGKTQLQDTSEKEGTMSEKLKSYPNPKFTSLEEEREYWEVHGPLAEGYKGRFQRSSPKRSSFLAVRLTGEELTRLRDVAAKQGVGPSTFARLVLTAAIEQGSKPPTRKMLDEVFEALDKNVSQETKDKMEAIVKAISIGNPPYLLELTDKRRLEEFAHLVSAAFLSLAGIQVVTPEASQVRSMVRV